MAEYRKPNLDGDGASGSSSYFQRTVILSDWWLIKCPNEFEGKRFGVSGTEIAASVESRAKRVFTSSPIIKAFDVFTIQASDGICITLRGFLNKEGLVKSGFLPEISREFIFGFPPSWEKICNDCFTDVNDGGKGKSKTLKSHRNVVEPVKHSRSKVKEAEENLSVEKTKRKIDFDAEVTPDKVEKVKKKTNTVSTDSVGQKRSRSGRLLVSSLEFWRNQIPVYDMNRNLTQIKKGHETNTPPSKGKRSDSRKARR